MGALAARLRALRSNKLALAGLAGAAGLGAFTLLRRGGAPADAAIAEAGAAASDSAGGTTGAQAFPSTYETDLAAAVGDHLGRYDDALSQFAAQVDTSAAAIAALTSTQTKQATDVASIAKRVEALKAAPVKKPPAKKATKKPAKKAPATTVGGKWKTITIGRGDTLGAIAKRYDTTVSALAKTNKIANVNRISAGAKLRVPA